MTFLQQSSEIDAWLLTDGHAGNLRQAQALARALQAETTTPALAPAAPWRWLAPRRPPGADHAFGPAFARELARLPAPRLAIGCGRQGALATRLLRERGAAAVQILDPRIGTRHWDLVVAPAHDGLRGDNVVAIQGSLHPVDEAWLAEAATGFPHLQALLRPRVALLVGGPTRHAPWTAQRLREQLAPLRRYVQAAGGSLLATVSRRTPAAVRAALREELRGVPGLLWEGEGPNPYPGLLACADHIVCTPDSVNMLSEACATAVPVFVLDPQLADGRMRAFLDALQAMGRVRPAGSDLPSFPVVPLRETVRVAAEVRRRLGLGAAVPPRRWLVGEPAEDGRFEP
ncbi:nucleoside-diphosphate sugar epimerase [Pseudoxanthomonas broegbernensis]|uniref:Nucleoside-diphosphate sugar epimerase n=1 Tax=Pseudoxanthomonas broegbernensis TaxID=83619 RepID=A0A7V8GNY0_9GAMM|nr:mitochondrial fission ELM1 family protein [Pseudoxanthomonas broegbernensis]KAF1687249.1 nucleoside-diphosphate sugar epimerase [Pseudoxanthomonas broegbernensis]MBB6065761.1 hypothetical protein [Pseudoxanthomonas broegbernensis]